MNEAILSQIWKKIQFEIHELKTEEGFPIIIQDPGSLNKDSGPDFKDAKLIIDHVLWVGTVELHVKSSDWFRHKHPENKEYENVILHVIWEKDGEIFYQNGKKIPQLVLSKYTQLGSISLMDSFQFIPCEKMVGRIPKEYLHSYFHEILLERLEAKSQELMEIYEENLHDLEGTFYQALGRVFGLPLNTQPMELLLKMIPLKMALNYRDNTLKIESIYLGLGGFLEEDLPEPYYQLLKKEFIHFKNKY